MSNNKIEKEVPNEEIARQIRRACAAPEMYDALKACLSNDFTSLQKIKIAQAALAKADGVQPPDQK